jgi:hypothetical protein
MELGASTFGGLIMRDEIPAMFADADGCPLQVGISTYVPWRWGRVRNRGLADRCALSRGVRMRDPETGEDLPRYHEIAFEV